MGNNVLSTYLSIKMKRYALFDFDGTITTKDTLFDFIRFTYGTSGLIKCISMNMWNLFLYATKLRCNEKAKERLLSTMLKGKNCRIFEEECTRYSLERIPKIINEETKRIIDKHKASNDTLIIVSASPEDWIKPWAKENGFTSVIATRLEKKNGLLTGKFASRNCYGKEKVNRIKEVLVKRESVYISAYGDSLGDKPMLDYANQGILIKKAQQK